MDTAKPRFGELLIKHQLITAENLEKVLQKQKAQGGKLSRLLVEMGFIEEDVLSTFLAKQLNIPIIDLKTYKLTPSVVQKIPESLSRRYQAILLEENAQGYLLGMVDPQDIMAIDELTHHLKQSVKLALVLEKDWLFAINSVYLHTEEISTYAKALSEEVTVTEDDGSGASLQDAYDAPVTKLLQSLFHDATQMRASDIHIEPDEKVVRIRQRIDGVLQENVINETGIAAALALRIKLMASLKIAEKRLPQDGRFSIKLHNRNIDVRVSTMPVQYGESIVMRLLDQSNINLKIDQLGIPAPVLKTLQRLVQLPQGMVLVTGPTGSGKTSTLYALLNELNSPENKIITVEDPVEYRLPRVNQVQINPQIGLTFAQVLRAALRQDPDVLMVGEVRDKETVSIALNAAMTGHFVLATMHTNDALSSALRILEMEGENYVVASGLRAVIAQRL
jgi:MSHA biogenesis protein MshE